MNPLQKAAVRRKLWYLGAILGLFTVSMLWRGMIPIPLSGREDGSGVVRGGSLNAADRVANFTIANQARRFELRELEQGDPEVLGSLARLSLVGSRGVAVTVLWYNAIEQQKRNDFHKFEQLVKGVTTLQPHFITPWIFQSWNIAYNVSVEMQSMGDMYFYIARGIELLCEGERRNKRSPDMRYQIGFYYQNKFGVADQVQTLRCLFDLSNIPPAERNPNDLRNPDKTVDLVRFRAFCEKNPLLVRRLRGEERRDRDRKGPQSFEHLRAREPSDVVDFLEANFRVPSRYKNSTELAARDQQFPVLPDRFNEGPDEAHPGMDRDPAFTAFLAARAWFAYANTLVPPNPKDEYGNPVPSATPRPLPAPGGFDPFKYRVPRLPMLIIFRQGPPRAQSYQAEMLQKDGWFDGSGWEVDAGVDDANAWFKEDQWVRDYCRGKGVQPTDERVTPQRRAYRYGQVAYANYLPRLNKLEKREDFVGNPDRKEGYFSFDDVKKSLEQGWEKSANQPEWNEVSDAVKAGFDRAVGTGREWSREAWEKAAGLWRAHGENTGLILDPARLQRLRDDARIPTGASDLVPLPPELTPDQAADERYVRWHAATTALFFFHQNRSVTNFPFYVAAAQVEAQPDTVRARKTLWYADQARRAGNRLEAIRMYQAGLEMWKGVLLANPAFHRPERFDKAEEETYEYELDYLRLLAQDDPRVRDKAREAYGEALGAVVPFLAAPPPVPATIRDALHGRVAETYFSTFGGSMPSSLTDGRAGTPWVRPDIKQLVLSRQGVITTPAAPPTPAPAIPGPTP